MERRDQEGQVNDGKELHHRPWKRPQDLKREPKTPRADATPKIGGLPII